MSIWIEAILLMLVLTSLALLGSSRLGACILMVALQGILLGLLTFVVRTEEPLWYTLLLSLGSMGIKGVAFPWLLSRALREAEIRREVEPLVGYNLSIVAGAFALAISMWLGARLPLPNLTISPLVIPVALFTLLVGLFLIVSRRIALTQVLGYLVLENGIYGFGVALAPRAPLIVELAIFLDVFVAVFVMGITIFHINREFDHIDTEQLSVLRDWGSIASPQGAQHPASSPLGEEGSEGERGERL